MKYVYKTIDENNQTETRNIYVFREREREIVVYVLDTLRAGEIFFFFFFGLTLVLRLGGLKKPNS